MASIKFLVRGKRNPSKITLRLIIDKNTDYRKAIPILVNPAYFNNKSGKIRQIAEYKDKKNIQDKLNELRKFLLEEFNKANTTGEFINSEWLKSSIDKHFNKIEEVDLNYLDNYSSRYLEKLKLKVNEKTGNLGATKATIAKYNTIRTKILGFQKFERKRFRIVDVNKDFRDRFLNYLLEEDRLARNTAGRYIKLFKTICLDAQKAGIKVSHELASIKGFKVDVKKIYLNFQDLEKLENATFETSKLTDARDWLLIGCYIGQRAGDLLQLSEKNISSNNDNSFINLLQQKTRKRVTIPIHPKVKEILNNRNGYFPPSYSKNRGSSLSIFNLHIKEVCRIAGIDEIIEGGKMNPKTGRKEEGKFPKYELVTSHICRRSFATNFYGKIPTPFLINTTGHSTESEFLNYIGKSPLDYAEQLAQLWSK